MPHIVADDPARRLRAALMSPTPTAAVAELARALVDEGMGQIALYRLYMAALDEVEEDRLHDALTDTMDLIWGGGWAKGRALFPEELSDERLRHGS